MPSSAPAKTVRGSCGWTVKPKTRLSLHSPFMTRRQLSPPSALSHSPLPIVPAQIVYLPGIVFLPRSFASVRAFPAGMRDVDDDAVRAGPFHLEIGMNPVSHRRIAAVLRFQPLAVRRFQLLAGVVEVVDLEAEMVDAAEIGALLPHVVRTLVLMVQQRDVDVTVRQKHGVRVAAQFPEAEGRFVELG